MLRNQCDKYGLTRSFQDFTASERETFLEKFIVDDRHKVILKTIPKTASTSWKTLFVKNMENFSDPLLNPHNWEMIESKFNLTRLERSSPQKLQEYFFIMTVRHPLARLESAYRDRIVFHKELKKGISVIDGFNRFLQRVLHGAAKHNTDIHWRPFTWHTQPCALPIK